MSPWPPELSWRAKRVVWGLDAHRLAWYAGGNQSGSPHFAPHRDALADALAQLPRRASLDVIAGNDVAVHWLQSPPSSARSLDALRLVAAARCAHLHGGSPQDWWIAAHWDASRPFVCAALPCAVVSPLRERLATSGVRARWHTGWGVACGARANTFPSEGWSALRSPTRMLLWHCRRGRADCLATLGLSMDTPDREFAAQALQQARLEGVRDASLTDGPVHWVTLAAPDGAETNEATVAVGLGSLLGEAAG